MAPRAVSAGVKKCSKCGELKSTSEFYARHDRASGLQSACKACVIAAVKESYWRDPALHNARFAQYRKKNPELHRATQAAWYAANLETQRQYHRALREGGRKNLTRYRMTPDDYLDLLKSQGGACAACGGLRGPFADSGANRPVVDHDHKCCPGGEGTCGGCVRGIIHFCCNAALGQMGDSVDVTLALADYLTRNPRPRAVAA